MNKEIQERARFDIVRYANCWEDADILCKALQPAEGKRFLSIASAGDNSFSLLAGGAEVVAADLSSAQLACVELRRAAFRRLSYEELLGFLGVRPDDARQAIYERIKKELAEPARQYWDANQSIITSGFIHAGKFESYFRKFREKVLPWVHSKSRIEQLLLPRTRNERIEFYNKRWNSIRWRFLFRTFFSRFVMGRLGRDPEFFRYVEGSVSGRILERTRHALTEITTNDNPYLTYILTGNYGKALPHYLRPENHDSICRGLDRLTLFHGSIQDAATAHAGSGFDGYNLSDVFEYVAPEICHDIYERLLNSARDGARFAYWNMLVPRECPELLRAKVNLLEPLSGELLFQDKAWFYSRFVVEEKKPSVPQTV